MGSKEPFNKLVKLAARAFYDDYTTKGDNQLKAGRSDNRGVAVVVLDALTRRHWVREDDLAKDLKLHAKQLRRTLRFFEEEKLVTRDHRKETAKGVKMFSAAVAATADGRHAPKEGEDKVKLHTHSYCCLDYAQIYDIVRYRLHRMKKKLKDKLDNKNTLQEYICPKCGKRYNALDAPRLISMEDDSFHCESCSGELVAESDNLAAQDAGDADDNARRRRREKLKDMLQKMEAQLQPLMEQLSRVKDLPVPEFKGLHVWEAEASRQRRAMEGDNANGSLRSSQDEANGLSRLQYLEDTKVVVDIHGEIKEEDSKSGTAAGALKILPPWMIKESMKLTKEQRGEAKQELKMDGKLAPDGISDSKKPKIEDNDEKNIEDEYLKAYYEAFIQKQSEVQGNQQLGLPKVHERIVGEKSKREESEEDDLNWEEAPSTGDAGASYKIGDLNVEAAADASPEDDDGDDDDIWEEG